MPDTEVLAPETKPENNQDQSKQPVSLGKVERINVSVKLPAEEAITDKIPNENNEGADATPKANESGAVIKDKDAAPQAPEITDEALKEYFKSKGIDYDGVDKLKEKLNAEPKAELTEEQKQKQALAKEKKLVDLFIARNGTVENYVGIKAIAEGDLSAISKAALVKELKESSQKFTDEEIQKIIKAKYFQFDEDEMEQEDEETEKDFKKRLKEYGANNLANRSIHTQKQAQSILKDLNDAIESENLQKQEEEQTSAKIDDYFKTAPRKLTFNIGDATGRKIDPITFEVPDSEIAEVQNKFKDAASIKKHFNNTDGTLNLNYLLDLETRNKYLESIVKLSYSEGESRNTEVLRKQYGSTAQEIGIGGAPDKTTGNGKIASFGKTQRVARSQHN